MGVNFKTERLPGVPIYNIVMGQHIMKSVRNLGKVVHRINEFKRDYR